MTLAAWLDARDGESLARAWDALGATVVEVGAPEWSISRHGAALFAASFLGWPVERLAWLGLPDERLPTPRYKDQRTTPWVFLERTFDVRKESFEYFKIWETAREERGLQAVCVAYRTDDGSREGTGSTGEWVVRVFDRTTSTAAAIFIGRRTVATIGEIDAGALSVFDRTSTFAAPSWRHDDREALHGLVTLLAAEIDAHFDVSTMWPARLVRESTHPDPERRVRTYRYESGARAIELADRARGRVARVHGLPWGLHLEVSLDEAQPGVFGRVELRMPIATGEAVLARLAAVPGLEPT